MANSDNVLTKLHDLLLYLIPQLGKFPSPPAAKARAGDSLIHCYKTS